jgi:acetyl-CoA synthetase
MTYESILKELSLHALRPNLVDYDAERLAFSWEGARSGLVGQADGGLNMAVEAVDRHADAGLSDKVAIRWIGKTDRRRELTYSDLAEESARFANALVDLGVGRGERLFLLCGRLPELTIAMIGGLKHGAVVGPLCCKASAESVRQYLRAGDGAVLVTTPRLYRERVEPIRGAVPTLRHVLLIGEDGGPVPPEQLPADTMDLAALLADASPLFDVPITNPRAPALLLFTSGATGAPKGVLLPHEAIVLHHTGAWYSLDLHPDDTVWCTADPSTLSGVAYGILAPLSHGLTLVMDQGDVDAQRYARILADERVCVWDTTPAVVRVMMRAGADASAAGPARHLRFIACEGEPLSPEAVLWGLDTYGLAMHDGWAQTEVGGVLIANYAGVEVRPGSMGRALPGVTVAVLQRDEDGALREAPVGEDGELAVRVGWPSMFLGYLRDDASRVTRDGWYLSGDHARMDADGFVWFIGRAEDVVVTSGHRVGPVEVESALLGHAAVAEVAVIGKPHAQLGQIVKAFVVLKAGFEPTDQIRREVLSIARTRLGPTVAPRELDFLPALPRTRTGKILRRLLRARELGLGEGDLSTMSAELPPPRDLVA